MNKINNDDLECVRLLGLLTGSSVFGDSIPNDEDYIIAERHVPHYLLPVAHDKHKLGALAHSSHYDSIDYRGDWRSVKFEGEDGQEINLLICYDSFSYGCWKAGHDEALKREAAGDDLSERRDRVLAFRCGSSQYKHDFFKVV